VVRPAGAGRPKNCESSHYDTFAEFQYSYHWGDMYAPYIKQEEPLKVECQHFLDCIRQGTTPISDGEQGLKLVQVLEAASASLRRGGAPVVLPLHPNGSETADANRRVSVKVLINTGSEVSDDVLTGRTKPIVPPNKELAYA